MKTVIYILIVIMFLIMIATSCTSVYWRETRKGGIETYQYQRSAWGIHHSCKTYESTRPVKRKTLNSYRK